MPSNPQLTAFPVFNGMAPTQGPRALPINFDFTTSAQPQVHNLLTENANGIIQYVQSVWVENDDNPNTLYITFQGTGQIIAVPSKTHGTWPVFSTDQVVVTLESQQHVDAHGKIILLNVPMPDFQSGLNNDVIISGDIFVIPSTFQGLMTNFSSTIVVPATAQIAIPANANRKGFIIANPNAQIESLYVDFNVAASPVYSIGLLPGEKFYSDTFFSIDYISVYAATGGHPFVAKELGPV